MLRSMHLCTEIYPNLKIQNVHVQVSILLYKHHAIIESPATRHTAVSAYGNSRVSPGQPHINAYEIFLQHDWLLFLDIIGSQKQLATYNFHIKEPTAFWRPVINRHLECSIKFYSIQYVPQ